MSRHDTDPDRYLLVDLAWVVDPTTRWGGRWAELRVIGRYPTERDASERRLQRENKYLGLYRGPAPSHRMEIRDSHQEGKR